MGKPKKVIPEQCAGFVIGEETSKYTRRDSMLYALGIGVSQDPLDAKDLKFTYENAEDFAAIPSMAVVLSSMENLFGGLAACPGLPEFSPMMLLHGEEKAILRKPLNTEATLKHVAKIKGVYDKQKGALVVIETTSSDVETNEVVCVLEHSLFIRGIGGFGGDSGPAAPANKPPKGKAPDATFTKKTAPNQALIYRLSGDYNPLHADPQFASMGGFDQPILHGLCTFGIATHAIVREVLNNEPGVVRSVEGRFSSPVTPGDALKVEMWREKGRVIFHVVNETKKQVCLANGALYFDEQPAAL